jgi:hypothetical protein
MEIGSRFIGRSLLGVVVSASVVLGFGVSGVSAADSGATTDNVCYGPVVVNEVFTIHRTPATHTHYGTAVFSSSTGLTETYTFSYVASAYVWRGTIILVDNSPFLRHDTLVHVGPGAVYFSEGGYITGLSGRWFNICKVFGDPGPSRL